MSQFFLLTLHKANQSRKETWLQRKVETNGYTLLITDNLLILRVQH